MSSFDRSRSPSTLHPRTRQVAVIDGAPPDVGRNAMFAETQRQIDALKLDIPIIHLHDLPLDELLVRVQALPPDTIIAVARQYIGPGGVAMNNDEAIAQVAQVAGAPVYVSVDQQIGVGSVGGIVVSMEGEGRALARLSLRIATNPSERIAASEARLVPMFDWRQLRRWGVDESRLPPGSVVRFRQLSVWEEYRAYIVGAAALLVLQSALIAGLVVQRAKQRRTELALRESERHFRVMADTAPVLIWRSGVDNACDFFNKAWLDFRGRTLDQEQGSGWTEGVHPDDLEQCRHVLVDAIVPREPFPKEYRLRRADGEYRWVLDVGVARYDDAGRFAGLIGSVIDITERKRIEESFRTSEAALRRSYEQNRDLAGRLIHAQEAERTRIARDLHDDVSQQLAGVGIMLSGLKRSLHRSGPGSEIDETVAALQERTATLAHNIRNLSHELHPGVLKHAGLAAALTQHCAEIQRHHGLTVTFNARDDLDALEFDAALCLYRVTQEALANIIRHARASVALVELLRTETGVELRVTDDGIAFVANERAGRGLGLRSIDERVRLAGGHVSVESQPGKGTNLVVRIPVRATHGELVSLP